MSAPMNANDDLTGLVCCVPIRCDPRWPGVQVRIVEEMVAAFGNPALGRGDHQRPMGVALDKAGVIHFMAMSVVWDATPADQPYLIVDVTGDGKWGSVIDAVVAAAGDQLLPVFEAACGVRTKAQLARRLKSCTVRAAPLMMALLPGRSTGLAFKGTPNLSVKRILKDCEIEERARAAIQVQRHAKPHSQPKDYWRAARKALPERLIDPPPAHEEAEPKELTDLVGQLWAIAMASKLAWTVLALVFASGVGIFVWAAFYDKLAPTVHDWRNWREVLGLVLYVPLFLMSLAGAALTTALILGGFVVFLLNRLRVAEDNDPAHDLDPDVRTVDVIMRRENLCAQNHMVGVSIVKPNWLRPWVGLPAALYIIGMAVTARIFKEGFLSDLGTIHAAQWMHLRRTNKLLFLSNYDGSWQSYLEDFITKASPGLTGIWSNTTNFPKAKWLFYEGATDGERFKRWARRQQIPTLFWYSAYPDLTTAQIRANQLIRKSLMAKEGTEADCQNWLDRFGSVPRPEYEIDTEEVQGLVLSGYRKLREGVCLVVRFPTDAAACREWLREISPKVSYGQGRDRTNVLFLGLTSYGLQGLGLDGLFDPMPEGKGPIYSNFPSAFVLGMSSPTRAGVLGDSGVSAPALWDWGGSARSEHAVLLIYADDAANLAAAETAERTRLATYGLKTVARIRLKQLPPADQPTREPFGFIDGISQPAIRGVLTSRSALSDDVVEPGEFILGYPDGREQFPATPQINAKYDAPGRLPNLPETFPKDDKRPPDVRDIGQNGSYLVIRQLRQDVAAFNDFVEKTADTLPDSILSIDYPTKDEKRKQKQDWLAAKLVGRWKDGAPLVSNPISSPAGYCTQDQSTFLFGKEDPQGLACPFGAHIRRANPRDNFGATDEDQIGLTNRHRLLRRGRTYVLGDDASADGDGILFMCLNADIERQFEFVQQTWVGSSTFGGLNNELDPLVGAGGHFTIPLNSGPLPLSGLKSFVTVKGGGYFFLPGKRALDFLGQMDASAQAAVGAAGARPGDQRPLSPLSPSAESTRTPDLVTATSPSLDH